MARGGSRGGSRSPPPRSSATSSRPMQPPPQQQQRPPVSPVQTQSSSGGLLGGIGSTIMTGMAFGAGSEIAHQAVRGLMGGSSHGNQQQQVAQQPPQQYNQQQQYQNPCQMQINNFSSCIQSNDEVSYCQSYSDMLKQCKKNFNLI